jgi:hypothetical protein
MSGLRSHRHKRGRLASASPNTHTHTHTPTETNKQHTQTETPRTVEIGFEDSLRLPRRFLPPPPPPPWAPALGRNWFSASGMDSSFVRSSGSTDTMLSVERGAFVS